MNALLLVPLICQSLCQNEDVRHHAKEAASALSYSAQVPIVDRKALESVYRLPNFEQARNRNADTPKAFLAQLNVWLSKLFETSAAERFSKTTRLTVFASAILVGIAAILRFISRRKKTQAALPIQTRAPVVPTSHMVCARKALSTNPRLALREGLLALLVFLEERRLTVVNRAKTNRELALELPTHEVGTLRSLLQWYDTTFYSLKPVAFDDAQHFLKQIETLAALPNKKQP